jgi:hypothetical protein
VLLSEATGIDEGWIGLEDGVAVQFPASTIEGQPNEYRSGDYWLIPARTAAGDVVWPRRRVDDQPEARPPNGVQHRYAPLALATMDDNSALVVEADCRSAFDTMPRANGIPE